MADTTKKTDLTFSLDTLKAVIGGRGGLAQPNRYEVQFSLPSQLTGFIISESADALRDLSILCTECTLPGKQILTMEDTLLRNSFKLPYGYINEDVSFNFMLTGDYLPKRIFEAWLKLIVQDEAYTIGYRDEFCSEIVIKQLHKGIPGNVKDAVDPASRVISTTTLHNAFPISFNPIQLTNEAENTIQHYSVGICYEGFTSVNFWDTIR